MSAPPNHHRRARAEALERLLRHRRHAAGFQLDDAGLRTLAQRGLPRAWAEQAVNDLVDSGRAELTVTADAVVEIRRRDPEAGA